MLTVLGLLCLLLPFIVYFIQRERATNPALRWPKLASMLGFGYLANPTRMNGQLRNRAVAIALVEGGTRISLTLRRPTRLRLEVGPKDLVTRRAGIVVPDPAPTGETAFDERLLVRCSDRAAAALIMDQARRQRIFALKHVDFLGSAGTLLWSLPEPVTEPEPLEEILAIMTAIAAELEAYPAQNA